MSPTDLSKRGPAVSANPNGEREGPRISAVTSTTEPAARESALWAAERRAEELAAALDSTRSELATARARLENAEEKIIAISEIAEAAQATIDKLRAEVADAEARTRQTAQQRRPAAGELPRSVRRRGSFKIKLSDRLASKLIGPVASLARVHMPRFGLDRARPSLITLADRARDAGEWEQAALHYRKALHRNPRNSPIWVQYGHALKETGRVAEAEEAYRKATELDPNAADPHLQLGHVLKLQRRRNDAVAAYLRALDLDPTLRTASLELVALGWTRNSLSRRNRPN
jgi:tetratricopeptide (TPR) repeat protein